MKFINDEISKYCDSVSDSDSTFLQDLRNYTIQNEELPQMVSGNMVGNVLQILIKSLDAKIWGLAVLIIITPFVDRFLL